jgi:anhydro-N-acetylmuramic acid kinase
MNELKTITRKRKKLVVGLNSGTSADGVDAVLIEIKGKGESTRVRLIVGDTLTFSDRAREFILRSQDPEGATFSHISRLNFFLGELFARAAAHIIEKAGLSPDEVDLIGSHGQTVNHLPYPERIAGVEVRATLQLGEPAVIAERTGITTVADFRVRDIAAGGEGAPLTSYTDYLLLRDKETGRIALNLGGIANITAIPAGASSDQVIAFDVAPGNILIDALISKVSGGSLRYDQDGGFAARGRIDEGLLSHLLAHPFLSRTPPRTTGREDFGEDYLNWVIEMGRKLSFNDIAATITCFTARAVGDAVRRFVFPYHPFSELIVSGGGIKNRYLIELLKDNLPELTVFPSDRLGIPADYKEAIAFAILANEAISGVEANLPQVTGAKRKVILGKIIPGG